MWWFINENKRNVFINDIKEKKMKICRRFEEKKLGIRWEGFGGKD